MPPSRDGKREFADRLRETAEDLMDLVAAQVKLIRLELLGDARNLGARLTRIAVFLPITCIGYACLAGAGAYALGTVIGFAWSLLIFGVVHGTVGTWGLIVAARTLREMRVLDRSGEELERSLKAVPGAISAPVEAPALPPQTPAPR
jgi:hypothetical protein